MDHAEAREIIDAAALEPDGFDRLVAGDTPEAIALAGHLAGCPACTEELERVRRVSGALRSVLADEVPAELRERTLALVRAVGRPRPADVARDRGPSRRPLRLERSVVLAWLGSIAAAVLVSVAVTGLALGALRDAEVRRQASVVEALRTVAAWSLRVATAEDARRVVLESVRPGDTGERGWGTLVFAPSTGDLVVVAEGLTAPPPGREYRCWVEIDGRRQRLGKMEVGDDLAYWVGPAGAAVGAEPGTRFGVTLVDVAQGTGEDVLVGQL